MIFSLHTIRTKSFSSLISKCLRENVKLISNDIYNLAKRNYSNNKNHNSDGKCFLFYLKIFFVS